uniref:Uncharacterized protein n=1 Tax=Setaria italica TaxID=4555 RepID=K3YB75_SETIT
MDGGKDEWTRSPSCPRDHTGYVLLGQRCPFGALLAWLENGIPGRRGTVAPLQSRLSASMGKNLTGWCDDQGVLLSRWQTRFRDANQLR